MKPERSGTDLPFKKQKCVVCGEAHSHKTVQTKKNEVQNVLIVGDFMSSTTEVVLFTRIKLSGNM